MNKRVKIVATLGPAVEIRGAKIFSPEKFACRLLQLRLFPSVGAEGLPQRRKPV